MEKNSLSNAASLRKNYHKILGKTPYSLIFVNNGIAQIILGPGSLLFKLLENEKAIARKFKQKDRACTIMVN